MSRSGYSDDWEDALAVAGYRANVRRSFAGKRGQKALRALLAALDAMPVKRLVTSRFQSEQGDVCVWGALARQRGIDVTEWDAEQADEENIVVYRIAGHFDVPACFVREVLYENDAEYYPFERREAPEDIWRRMHEWLERQIKVSSAAAGPEERA